LIIFLTASQKYENLKTRIVIILAVLIFMVYNTYKIHDLYYSLTSNV